MKKLLLLCAMAFFACGSDNGVDVANNNTINGTWERTGDSTYYKESGTLHNKIYKFDGTNFYINKVSVTSEETTVDEIAYGEYYIENDSVYITITKTYENESGEFVESDDKEIGKLNILNYNVSGDQCTLGDMLLKRTDNEITIP